MCKMHAVFKKERDMRNTSRSNLQIVVFKNTIHIKLSKTKILLQDIRLVILEPCHLQGNVERSEHYNRRRICHD